jgi:hypothetical protein
MRRQFKRERRKAALVFAQAYTVEPDGGGGHHSLEVHKDAAAARTGGQAEAAAIDGDKLVGFLVEAVPGSCAAGVAVGL